MMMKGILRTPVLLSFAVLFQVACLFAQESHDLTLKMLSRYIDLRGAQYQVGIEDSEKEFIVDEMSHLLRKLLEDKTETGEALISIYQEELKSGGTSFTSEVMKFASHHNLARRDFLEFARDLIDSTDLGEPRDPLLTTALEYLGENGEESDLEVMAKLDGHINPTYTQIRDRFAARLKERLAMDNVVASKAVDSPKQQTEPTQVPKIEFVVKSEREESPRLSTWVIVVAVVAVLGILVLLIRAFLGSRAS